MAELVKKAQYRWKKYFPFKSGLIEYFHYIEDYPGGGGMPRMQSIIVEVYIFGKINGNEKIIPDEVYIVAHKTNPLPEDLKIKIELYYKQRYPTCKIVVS